MAEFAETAHEKAESAGGKGRFASLLDRSFVQGVSIVTGTHGTFSLRNMAVSVWNCTGEIWIVQFMTHSKR